MKEVEIPESAGAAHMGGTHHVSVIVCRRFCCLNKAKSPKWVMEGDIKGCFDNISHEWILNHIPMDRDILRKWLKSGYIETGRLFPTELGSPQGGLCGAPHNDPYAERVIMPSQYQKHRMFSVFIPF